MRSRLLSISLGLNLLLLGIAGYCTIRNQSIRGTPPPTGPISLAAERSSEPVTVAFAVVTASAPLRWIELESEDYPTYVANLRKAGCPEPVLRRIIRAELKELYVRKAFALAQEFHRDFWVIAARENVREYFEKTLAPQVATLCEETDTLLKQLIGDASGEETDPSTISPPESRSTPEELVEYKLRQSSATKEIQALYGVDFSETELRNVAIVLDEYHRGTDSQAETDPDALEQKLKAALGPARFTEFNRARSAGYQELYEVITDFGRPTETAAEIFDLRLASEKRSDQIRADKNRPSEEKQTLLDDLEERVEQAVRTKLGTAAYQSYKSTDGRWINALGRL